MSVATPQRTRPACRPSSCGACLHVCTAGCEQQAGVRGRATRGFGGTLEWAGLARGGEVLSVNVEVRLEGALAPLLPPGLPVAPLLIVVVVVVVAPLLLALLWCRLLLLLLLALLHLLLLLLLVVVLALAAVVRLLVVIRLHL